MKSVLWLSPLVVTLGLLPGTAAADGCFYLPPFKIQGNIQFHVTMQLGQDAAGGGMEMAPWYLYFPAGAGQHQAVPPSRYPNWPAQAPTGAVGYAPHPYAPAQPAVQRAGYYPATPSYWYGN